MPKKPPSVEINMTDPITPGEEAYQPAPAQLVEKPKAKTKKKIAFTVEWTPEFASRVERAMQARNIGARAWIIRDALLEYMEKRGL